VLIVGGGSRDNQQQALCKQASQNLPWVTMVYPTNVSVLKLIQHSVLVVGVDGLQAIEARFEAPIPFANMRRTWPPGAVLREYKAEQRELLFSEGAVAQVEQVEQEQ